MNSSQISAATNGTHNNELVKTKKSLTKWERVNLMKHAWGLKWKCLGFYGVSLKVEEDQELNMVFTAATQISVKRHFWRCEFKSWYLRLGLMFRVKN